MPIKAVTCYLATCDVCSTPYGSAADDECLVHSTTYRAAIEAVHDDPEWLVTTDGRVICLANDEHHQAALDAMLPPSPPTVCTGQITLPIDL